MSSRIIPRYAIGLALLAASFSGSALARTAFDGTWSVLIITEAGTCDRAYRYDVRVENGALRYGGDAPIDLAGRVTQAGRVQVMIGRGSHAATGTGRLSRTVGRGTWTGRSSHRQCSGRWEAERR